MPRPPFSSPPRFAAVVVTIETPPGMRQPFTYRIPEEIGEDLEPGACVVVPFGTRTAIGYVIGVGSEPPKDIELEKIRPIFARVQGDGAQLPAAVLQTARWVARYYLTDLATSVRGAIPSVQAAHAVRRLRLNPGWETYLADCTTSSHRLVIEALAGFPEHTTTENELARALGDIKADSPVRLLRQRAVIRDLWSVEPPRTGAKQVKAVRLLLNWDDAEIAARKREEKAPAQARLLRTLAAAGGGPLPVADAVRDAQTSASTVARLEAENAVATEIISLRRRPYKAAGGAAVPPLLMREQAVAVDEIARRLHTRESSVALLYGVTGSGKTEVYLRAIAETRRLRRTALVLVPEIALTAQLMDNFRARIGDRVAVLHSALSDGERRDEWQRIGRGAADVVVGARSAVFSPLENVGLIVVDEEHESSYKQDQPSPRYHARDVAIARARATGATVLLGSATPSVESFYQAESDAWKLLPLRERALSRPLPQVQVVDLREEWKKGAPGLFSPPLIDAISERLAKNEQTILFLNRRGFAMFLLCRDCGFTTRCPHCDVSLTFHQRAAKLVCHHCNYEKAAPTLCPSCSGRRLRPFGIGTERVEEEVKKLFAEARVLRMDRDTTGQKDAHLKMLQTFRAGHADILIGTQMVAKGLDFAGVTLVGVVSADTALNLPDFRASERAFQLLTQVAGRAGRGRKPGQVIVQTFNPEHESVVAAAEHDYETFYRREITSRRELSYPPFTRLANIVASDEDGRQAEARLRVLASRLGSDFSGTTDALIGGDSDLQILGPASCPLSRLRGKYRWHLLLKGRDADTLRERVRAAFGGLSASERSGITLDMDPMSVL